MRSAIAAVVIAVLSTTGCGSSSNKTLSRSELIAKANVICKRLNAKRTAINVKAQREFAEVLPRFASETRAAFSELGELKPPASLASDWKQIVASGRALASDTNRLAGYVAAYNSRAIKIETRSTGALFEAIHLTAKQDGIARCAEL